MQADEKKRNEERLAAEEKKQEQREIEKREAAKKKLLEEGKLPKTQEEWLEKMKQPFKKETDKKRDAKIKFQIKRFEKALDQELKNMKKYKHN